MDYEKPFQFLSDQQSAQAPLVQVVRRFLSAQETARIIQQFQSKEWIPNGQVLWSGMPREVAQEWADRHQLQTLTTAMGPLMDEKHPECLKLKKNQRQWKRYVHGASAIFAWRIAQAEKVTLLSPPPPERFHPSGLSYYQLIEEPIIRGLFGRNSVKNIMITHPMILEGKDDEFFYELWPNDRSEKWVEQFGSRPYKVKWRQVGHSNDIMELRSLMTSSERQAISCGQFKQVEHQQDGLITPIYTIFLLPLFLLPRNGLQILVICGLLYSLLDQIGGDHNATNREETTSETTGSTSIAISSEDINTEQDMVKWSRDELNRQRSATQIIAVDKIHQEATKKLEDEVKAKRKSLGTTHQEATKKLEDEVKAKRKSLGKTHQEATKKLEDEVKAKRKSLGKTYQEATKKLEDEVKAKRKSLGKTHQEATKKLEDEVKAKRKSLDKTHQEAVKKLN